MPFRSKAQQGYMYANHPQIAKRWEDTYGIPKGLPRHVKGAPMKKNTQMFQKGGMGPSKGQSADRAVYSRTRPPKHRRRHKKLAGKAAKQDLLTPPNTPPASQKGAQNLARRKFIKQRFGRNAA